MSEPDSQDQPVIRLEKLTKVYHRGSEPVAARWNSTAVYHRTDGTWKSIHSHFSFIKPELKVTPREEAR